MDAAPASNASPDSGHCALCRSAIDLSTALYGDSGQICDACGAREDMKANLLRSVKSSGYGTLAPAAVSWIFNPIFALTIAAVVSAVWTFKAYGTSDLDEREFLAKHRGPMVAAVIGLVIAGIPLLNTFFGLTALL